MPTLRNVNPLGEIDLPLVGRTIGAGEDFDLPVAQAAVLLAQAGNYELSPDSDLSTLTIADLQTLAAGLGLDVSDARVKADYIAAVTAVEVTTATGDDGVTSTTSTDTDPSTSADSDNPTSTSSTSGSDTTVATSDDDTTTTEA